MAERTPFLLRLDPEVLAALRRWADDDLRSLNGQIEFLLRRSLRDAGRLEAGRLPVETGPPAPNGPEGSNAQADGPGRRSTSGRRAGARGTE